MTTPSPRSMRPFLTIWIGQIFSLLGSELVTFALIWYLTKQTGSATVLAVAALLGMAPTVILGPLAGVLVDRWNRRLTMIAADGLVALATIALAVLFAAGVAQVWHIYLILLLRGIGRTFHYPAMAASTSLMVPDEHLIRINGLNQALNGGMQIISAPLGAILLELLPVHGILAIDVVTALIAISPLLFVMVPQPERHAADKAAGVLADMRAGLRYVWGWRGLMILLLMAAVLNLLLVPAFSLMPLLVAQHFQRGALQLGWMQSGFGLGIIAGGVALGAWGGFKRKIFTSMMGLAGMGVGILAIGVAPGNLFLMGLAGMAFTGVMMPLTNGSIMSIMQAVVAPAMQGRVFTTVGSAATGLSILGLIFAGPLSDRFGLQTWYVLGGIACLLMALLCVIVPATRHLEDRAAAREAGAAEAELEPVTVPAA